MLKDIIKISQTTFYSDRIFSEKFSQLKDHARKENIQKFKKITLKLCKIKLETLVNIELRCGVGGIVRYL